MKRMQNLGKYLTKILFLSLVPASFHSNAAGQGDIEKYGSWFYQCKAINTRKTCALKHVQLFKDKKPALTLAIVDPGFSGKLIMHFKVPLGVYLPDGLRHGVDARRPSTDKFLDCNQSGCVGMISLGDDHLWAIKAGNKMQVEYTHQRGRKTVKLDVPLGGVTKGIARIQGPGKARLNEDKAKEAARKEAALKEAVEQETVLRDTAEENVTKHEAEPEGPARIKHWFTDLFSSKEEAGEAGSGEADSNSIE